MAIDARPFGGGAPRSCGCSQPKLGPPCRRDAAQGDGRMDGRDGGQQSGDGAEAQQGKKAGAPGEEEDRDGAEQRPAGGRLRGRDKGRRSAMAEGAEGKDWVLGGAERRAMVVVLEEHGAGFGELPRAWLADGDTRDASREAGAARRLDEGRIDARGRARPWAASCWWSAARRHGRGRGQGRGNRASPLEALDRSGTVARGWGIEQ